MIHYLKTRGFTDRLYFLNLTLSWIFIIVSIGLTLYSINHDYQMSLDVVAYGIPAIFAELSVHTGFIIWKAKTENLHKYKRGVSNERYFDDSTEGDSIDSDDSGDWIFDPLDEDEA